MRCHYKYIITIILKKVLDYNNYNNNDKLLLSELFSLRVFIIRRDAKDVVDLI